MVNVFRFKEFPVYKESLALSRSIRKLANKFPVHEKFGIASQIIRATDSISLNIAEGSNRYSDKDFSKFLNLASSSAYEVSACLDICKENNYITLREHHEFTNIVENIYRQLMALTSKVRKTSRNH